MARPSSTDGTMTAVIGPALAECPVSVPVPPADRASRTSEPAITPTHQDSAPPRRSRRTRRDSTSTSATPEASTGCTTLTGSNVKTMTWQARPVSISPNPASQAGLASRLPTTWATRRSSSAGIRPRARFSRIRPVL